MNNGRCSALALTRVEAKIQNMRLKYSTRSAELNSLPFFCAETLLTALPVDWAFFSYGAEFAMEWKTLLSQCFFN
jgi:hypothetical protein